MKKKNQTITDYPQKFVTFLFHLMILMVPFFFTWVNEELFEFNKMILVYGFSTLIATGWVMRMLLHKKIIFRRTLFDIPLGLFLLSQILSTLFSIHPRTSIFGYYTRFHGGLLSTFSYITLYYAFVNNFNKKHLKYFFLTIFISAIGVSLYALPEHFGHSPSCLMISGQFNVDCWQQKVQDRIFGTFGQPNWLAAYAIMLIPLGTSLFLKSSFSKIKKDGRKHLDIIFASAVAMLLSVTIFTQSRSGFLGLGLAGLLYAIGLLVLYFRDIKNSKYTLPWKKTSLFATVLLLIIAWFGTPVTPKLMDLINQQSNQPIEEVSNQAPSANRLDLGGTDSGEIRKIVWTGAFDVWKRYPIFGSGVETFAYSYYKDRPVEHNLVSEWDFLYNKAHNELLNFMATTGTIGIISYLSLFIWFGFVFIKEFFKKEEKKNTISKKLIILGLTSGLVALFISNFFGFSTVMVSVLMFLFFAFLDIQVRKEKTEPQTIKVKLEFWDYVWMTGIGLIAISFLFQIFNIWHADYTFTKGKRLIDAGYISEGGPYLQRATEMRPNEDLFYDKFATTLGNASLIFAEQEKLPEAQGAAQSAIMMSNTALELNPVHLNLYKTRIRLFMNLGLLDKQMIIEAKKSSIEALKLAPTDAKLVFNLGLIEEALGNNEVALEYFEKTVEMKENYGTALNHLAEIKLKNNKPKEALDLYEKIVQYFPNDKITADKVATLEAQLNL